MLAKTRNACVIGLVFFALAFALALSSALPAWAVGLNGDPNYTNGPNVCSACHPTYYDDWLSHGHSRKLALGSIIGPLDGSFGATADARSMGIVLPAHDTDVYNWNNILFVIGASKHWKTRYVDLTGFIITKNGLNQYNWIDGSFSDYDKDQQVPFSCGECHTTGFMHPDQGGDGFAGIPGIIGDFSHINITCEACHGAGQLHANTTNPANITVDTAAAKCGECHTRGNDPTIVLSSGGFIRHHEQYPELLNSPHDFMTCVTCHDPHVTRAKGIKVQAGQTEICAQCHAAQVTEFTGSIMQQNRVRCQDCHMGKATLSAITEGPFEGDTWTHLFKINSDSTYTMFTPDGSRTAVDTEGEGALSIEFACARCHAEAGTPAGKAAFAEIGTSGTPYHTIGK
jgi:predicted CXXCH cytochrome family protein